MVLSAKMACAALDIGTEARLVLGEDGAEFGLYVRGSVFHILHPVELSRVVELDLGQAGEIIAARFLEIDGLASKQDVEGLVEPGRALGRRDQTVQPGGIVRGIIGEPGLGAPQAGLNRSGKVRHLAGEGECGAIPVTGGLDIAARMADIAEQEQAAKIVRGLCQHGVQRVGGSVPVSGAGPVEGSLFQLAK